jgi:hypothetical protein
MDLIIYNESKEEITIILDDYLFINMCCSLIHISFNKW